MATASVFTNLDDEWAQISHRRRSQQTYDRWAQAQPQLPCPASLGDLIAVLHASTPSQSDPILKVLVGMAGHDELAARTTLQAVLPGVRRCVSGVGGKRIDVKDNESIALTAAWQMITCYPIERRPRHIAANIVLDARQAIHSTRVRRLQDQNREQSVMPGFVHPAVELVEVLTDAVALQIISAADAQLIVASRIDDEPLEDLANVECTTYGAIRTRRLRAEQRLRRQSRATIG